eukprot:TRINITY_DN21484_c0_g1_i1.p1 TRINITY_DN21484_c0_g1~~TRINITY_DN21484_c0_g1_i1.p1  ORF type:complete len:217 (+),score=40.12 TRINITY_DN21484_c0_g1_i1:70-720(+)
MAQESLVLHGYWQSSCTWRVRLAMAFKGLNYEYRAVNIVKGEQFDKGFLKLNPLGLVPVLEVEGALIADSIAILEFLEERYPDRRPLLPKNLTLRAAVRQFVAAISSGIQPYQNLRVGSWVEDRLGAEERLRWVQLWIATGFKTLEEIAKSSAGKYCFGNDVTLADVALIPQLASADRFKLDMSEFPTLSRIGKALYELPEVQQSVPKNQPDAPQR